MNHLARILEVVIDGTRQGTVHLDINGKIRISKIKYDRIDENLFKSVQTQMLDKNQSYGFGYKQYQQVLQNNLARQMDGHSVEIREKYLNQSMERLMVKSFQERSRFTPSRA